MIAVTPPIGVGDCASILKTPVILSALFPKKPALKKLLEVVLTQLEFGSYCATPVMVFGLVLPVVVVLVPIVPFRRIG